ncbi:MAG: hypothetical protein AB1744_13140 [Candidatus Zixiibacteriota bacterium]
MISTKLLLSCLAAGGAYLLVSSLVLEVVGRALKITRGLPGELTIGSGWTAIALQLAFEFFFFVAIPTLAYAFFYFLLPLVGIRAGLAAALFAFSTGAVPALVGLGLRLNFSMLYLLFALFSLLVKLGGCLSLIGYLYYL